MLCGGSQSPRVDKLLKKEVRNFKHFREADFISDLQNMPWHEIESTKDPNIAWKKWESGFNEVLNRHAP